MIQKKSDTIVRIEIPIWPTLLINVPGDNATKNLFNLPTKMRYTDCRPAILLSVRVKKSGLLS